MTVEVLAIDQIDLLTAPRVGAVYAVTALVDGREYTFRVSIIRSTMDGRQVHIQEFCDDQDELVFGHHWGFVAGIYSLVLDVFCKRDVLLPAELDESAYTFGPPQLEVRPMREPSG